MAGPRATGTGPGALPRRFCVRTGNPGPPRVSNAHRMPARPLTRRSFAASALGLLAGCGGPRIELGGMRKRGEPITWHRAALESETGLGPIDQIAAGDRWAYGPEGFEPLPVAVPGDWLWSQHEEPQGVGGFLLGAPNRAEPPRTTIILVALGELDGLVPGTDTLRDYLERFFGLPVAIAEPLSLPSEQLDAREHGGHRQLRAGRILDELEPRLPEHAYCMLAVTRDDLYPGPGWNFVFGQARLHARVGVQSLLRYDPAFEGRTDAPAGIARRRGLAVVSHEVGHMFGISHCVHHRCVMNGFNNLLELDRTPMHLCRVCLRKLQLVVPGLDLVARYERLREHYLRDAMLVEAAWVQARLAARVG